ncbi:MAG TPA: hypothetical protein VGP99_05335 [Tepidisphaeraceae bacterium]|nr:hypothetical protein [Tepidisphaeraceae bacterium]
MELERNIREAWLQLRGKILSDPHELHRRLARRRSKSLTKPPRAWCIAIRASDRRITPAHWVITPEHAMDLNHPDHPYEPIEHEVTIQTHAIRRCCHPVSFSREDAADVAKMLGVSPAMLMHARYRGQFEECFYKGLGGKRGKPVPLLSPKGQLLDPGAMAFARPHPIWGSMWEWLAREMPADFEQTILRRPYFRPPTARNASPTGEVYKDEMQHIGWRWVCPVCRKQVRTIFYPLPVRTLFDTGEFTDPVIQKRLCDADLPQPPPPMFACHACHGIRYFSSVVPDSWNRAIAWLTAGMLYGSEVQKPASFVPERKKARSRQLNRQAPVRRKVLTRLRLGWSDFQIARDLGLTASNVGQHVWRICREERVANRYALARKLNFAPQRLNYWEAAKRRRLEVAQMMLNDCTWKEMMEKLGVGYSVLCKDIKTIYKAHGIKPQTHRSKPELARKMGRPFVSRWETLLAQLKELRDSGMKWRAIASHIGVSLPRINSYRQALARRQKASIAKASGDPVESRAMLGST